MLNLKGYTFVSIVSILISIIGIELLTKVFDVLVKIPAVACVVTIVILLTTYYLLFQALTQKDGVDNKRKK